MNPSMVSLSVPTDDYNALMDAATFLDSLAQTARKRAGVAFDHVDLDKEKEADVVLEESGLNSEPVRTAEEVFGTSTESGAAGTETEKAQPAGDLPWDERIHSSGRTVLKSGPRAGCWRYKNGVDEATIAAVEAELRQVLAVNSAAAADAGATPPPPPAVSDTGAATPPPPPVTQANFANMTFAELAARITAAEVQLDSVDAAVSTATGGQLTSFTLLLNAPDVVPKVAAILFPEG